MLLPLPFLRPPGVVSEKEFRARCISCWRCVAACVFHCIAMTPDSLFGAETPKVFHRRAPCYLCMKCGPACPTEALRSVPMEKAGMGMAVLDGRRCVDYQTELNLMCWTCYERCPLRGTAIVLENGYRPVIMDACVGCGVCEYVCPVRAISVVPARFQEKR
jgi:NAD-dependent dihydropyrimidine dehydrogenase PreA subunit